MANIIRVRIALKGTQSDIDAMYAKVATENNEFDFNAIIPCPAELAEFEDTKKLLGMSKEKSAELVSKYGFSSPYLWRMEHWGTKDNNRSEEVMGGAWFSEDIVELATSDCFPYPVLAELSKQFPNVDMDFIFADEDAGCNAGNGSFRNGEVVTGEYRLPDNSEEACRAYASLYWEYDCEVCEKEDGTFYVEFLNGEDCEDDEEEDEEEEDW